jgi:hypothetical protein
MRHLHPSHPQPAAQAVQPGMPALRCPNDPAAGNAEHQRQRVQHPKACNPCQLGGAWPQRGADTRLGQRAALRGATAYWPGIHFGVRGPTQDETPLSWEEVQLGLEVRAIRTM